MVLMRKNIFGHMWHEKHLLRFLCLLFPMTTNTIRSLVLAHNYLFLHLQETNTSLPTFLTLLSRVPTFSHPLSISLSISSPLFFFRPNDFLITIKLCRCQFLLNLWKKKQKLFFCRKTLKLFSQLGLFRQKQSSINEENKTSDHLSSRLINLPIIFLQILQVDV